MSSTVEIVIKGVDQASKAFGDAHKAAGGLGDSLAKIGGGIIKAGLLGAAAGTVALGAGLWSCVNAASGAEQAQADLGAVLASTGKAAEEQAKAWANAQGKWVEVATAGKDALSAADIEGIGDQIEVLTARLHDQEAAFAKAKKPTESMGVSIQQTKEKIADLNAELQTSTAKSLIPMTQALGLVAPVARVTAEMANELASSLQGVTRFEDDVILAGESMLLTFTNIGANVFPQATEAMLNLAQKMGTDPTQAAIQLGKALNDPIKGITALQRVGVAFTDAQEKMIKGMVAAGDIAGAQKLILKELETEFGGVARAAGATLAGKLDILKNKFGDVQESIGEKLLPGLTKVADTFGAILDKPEIQTMITNIADGFGRMAETLGEVIGQLAEGDLSGALETLFGPETAAQITGVLDALKPVADFISANLQPILIGVGAAAAVAFGVWAASAASAAVATITLLAPAIAIMAAVGLAVGLLAAAWTGNWGGIRDTLTAVWENTLKPALETLRAWLEVNVPKAMAWLANVWETVLKPALEAIWAFIRDNVLPIIVDLAELGFAVLSLIVRRVAAAFEEKFIPNIAMVWDWLKKVAAIIAEKLQPVMEWLRDKALPPIAAAFESLAKIVEKVFGWIGKLADAINRLPSMPSYSGPTVEVTGGWNVPAYQKGGLVSGLLGAPQLAMVHGGELIIPPGRSTERIAEIHHHWNLTINSAATTENLPGDFAMLQAMAG